MPRDNVKVVLEVGDLTRWTGLVADQLVMTPWTFELGKVVGEPKENTGEPKLFGVDLLGAAECNPGFSGVDPSSSGVVYRAVGAEVGCE